MSANHDVELHYSGDAHPGIAVARCSCGWFSLPLVDDDAVEAWIGHAEREAYRSEIRRER